MTIFEELRVEYQLSEEMKKQHTIKNKDEQGKKGEVIAFCIEDYQESTDEVDMNNVMTKSSLLYFDESLSEVYYMPFE